MRDLGPQTFSFGYGSLELRLKGLAGALRILDHGKKDNIPYCLRMNGLNASVATWKYSLFPQDQS